MVVVVELHCAGEQVTGLPDPNGGRFDAAGDFDSLLPTTDPAFPILGRIETYDDRSFDTSHMTQLLGEIDVLLPATLPGPAQRGLIRLRALASACAQRGGCLIFRGD
jgi:hypothetical protein